MSNVVGVLLAAGAGSRFTGPTHKLLARLDATAERPSETVVERSLASLIAADIGPIVVVTGAADVTDAIGIGIDIDGIAAPGGRPADQSAVMFAHNPDWADGQASSVQTGVAAARRLDADRVVFGLGDQPGVTSAAWRTVAASSTGATITVASYDGRRGNPVAVGSELWDLLPEEGDEGARSLMRLRPDLVVEVPCSGSSDDIDTTEDLRRWQNNSSTNSP